MGTATLVVASAARELVERPRRPTPSTVPPAPAAVAPLDQRAGHTARPRSFAEDWGAPATGRPPTTVANPETDIMPPEGDALRGGVALRPRPLGERYRRLSPAEPVAWPYVDWQTGRIDLPPDGTAGAV